MGLVRRQESAADRDRWPVEQKVYRAANEPRGLKQIVLGPDDGATNFAMRVFQIDPGKSSNEEEHPHDHGVYVMRGRARVLLGTEYHEAGPGDFVWVAPDERHCFESLGPEPLQFICVVPAWGEPDARNVPPRPGSKAS
jgi:quercetin dioxygenase-like cupin family protein